MTIVNSRHSTCDINLLQVLHIFAAGGQRNFSHVRIRISIDKDTSNSLARRDYKPIFGSYYKTLETDHFCV
jgi:hypothetical protein